MLLHVVMASDSLLRGMKALTPSTPVKTPRLPPLLKPWYMYTCMAVCVCVCVCVWVCVCVPVILSSSLIKHLSPLATTFSLPFHCGLGRSQSAALCVRSDGYSKTEPSLPCHQTATARDVGLQYSSLLLPNSTRPFPDSTRQAS